MLQADYLEFIHDALVVLLWPGSEPIGEREYRDRRLLESAAARPFHTVLGEDAYPTILRKAAALFHSIKCEPSIYEREQKNSGHCAGPFLDSE